MFVDKGEEIKAACHKEFRWDVLLKRIKLKNVIPVIGQGLYRVDIDSEGKRNCLLYDYLAERVSATCGATAIDSGESHKFAKACFDYLKKESRNDAYLNLTDLLKKILEGVRLVPDDSLWKLARIKNFGMFINTTYDDLLAKTIKSVRKAEAKTFSYTGKEKKLYLLNEDLFNSIKNSECTLVYQIFGNFTNMKPAYAEKDILETIMKFNEDMKAHSEDIFFQELGSSTLLFIGCGYDDWLFRFFIRILSNQSYELFQNNTFKLFAADDFYTNKKDPFYDLLRFLKGHNAVDCSPYSGENFVDRLFKNLERDDKDEIIQPPDFPEKQSYTAFISFEGTDRKAAKCLANNLRKDGLRVWLDEDEFKGGDGVDETISESISKCPVFIPLISRNSQQLLNGEGKLKYHVREWELAFANVKSGNKGITIIPVKIDDTDWIYDKFEGIYHYKIPGGGRSGEYKKLRDQLKKIQQENQDV